MAKWKMILCTLVFTGLVYAFLLLGMPALERLAPPLNEGVVYDSSNISINWTPINAPSPRLTPYRVDYKAPWLIYIIPGLVGMAFVIMIIKKGEKQDE